MSNTRTITVNVTLEWRGLFLKLGPIYLGRVARHYTGPDWAGNLYAGVGDWMEINHKTKAAAMAAVEKAVIEALGGKDAG